MAKWYLLKFIQYAAAIIGVPLLVVGSWFDHVSDVAHDAALNCERRE